MTSLSNIWQSVAVKESKVIGLKPIRTAFEVMDDTNYNADLQAKKELQNQHLQEVKAEAEQMLAAAKLKIEEQKKQWETDRQELVEQAQLEGYQKGFATGQQEGLQSYQASIAEAKRLAVLAQQDYEATVEASEDAVLELGLKLAEKVLHAELTAGKERYVQLVKGAISDWKERSDVRIFVHPDSYELVLQQKEELAVLAGKDFDISILPQHDMQAGGCMLETKHGRIDASIDSQLTVLRDKLFEIRREGNA
jgi:flagellar assembly protein FliH